MKTVVVLEVMWGLPGDPRRRWFDINPLNHSGKRLIKLIGHTNFIVTNACPDVVWSARGRGTPDKKWLEANLRALDPDLLLVCGRVAGETFERHMVRGDTQVLRLPHPAARTWSKESIARTQRKIRKAQFLKETA
jgi:hypothetical protein